MVMGHIRAGCWDIRLHQPASRDGIPDFASEPTQPDVSWFAFFARLKKRRMARGAVQAINIWRMHPNWQIILWSLLRLIIKDGRFPGPDSR